MVYDSRVLRRASGPKDLVGWVEPQPPRGAALAVRGDGGGRGRRGARQRHSYRRLTTARLHARLYIVRGG